MIAHIAEQFELESSRMEKEIEAAMRDRNEAIRRYNALHQLGQMAKDCGIDLSAKLPEHEQNKWKDFKYVTHRGSELIIKICYEPGGVVSLKKK